MDFETENRNRIMRLEQKVDFLLRELNLVVKEEGSIPDPGPFMNQVVELVRQNRKIEAIKLYRERTGVGLKEAKDAVDKLS